MIDDTIKYFLLTFWDTYLIAKNVNPNDEIRPKLWLILIIVKAVFLTSVNIKNEYNKDHIPINDEKYENSFALISLAFKYIVIEKQKINTDTDKRSSAW